MSTRPGALGRAALTWLSRIQLWLAVLCLVVFASVTFVEIVSRSVFSQSQHWSPEIARLALVWSVCMGAAVAFRSGSHLSIDLLRFRDGSRLDRAHRALISLVNVVFLAALAWYGAEVVLAGSPRGTAVLGIPMIYGFLAPLIMGVTGALYVIEEALAPDNVEDAARPPGALESAAEAGPGERADLVSSGREG